jgi:hypothetical protein
MSEPPAGNLENQHYVSLFLLVSFVSWYVTFAKTGRTYPAKTVLASLLTIRESKLERLAFFAFFAFFAGFKAAVQLPRVVQHMPSGSFPISMPSPTNKLGFDHRGDIVPLKTIFYLSNPLVSDPLPYAWHSGRVA